jgi:hypothetical protein
MVVPSLRIVLEHLSSGFSKYIDNIKLKKMLFTVGAISLVLMSGAYLSKTDFSTDLWSNDHLLRSSRLPYLATRFIKQQLASSTPTNIFNEFSWGGYLNWNLPEARVYIDGRGSGTWLTGTSTPFLKSYYDLMFGKDGLKSIESNDIQYILIRPEYREESSNLAWPNSEFYKPATSTQSQLRTDLLTSKNWKKIYSDDIAEIWKVNR